MRAVIAGCALILIGSAAAQAQPYDGNGYPPPPPPYDDGYRHHPPPGRYGGDFDGPPPPPRHHHRHCRIVEDLDGPYRICRPDF